MVTSCNASAVARELAHTVRPSGITRATRPMSETTTSFWPQRAMREEESSSESSSSPFRLFLLVSERLESLDGRRKWLSGRSSGRLASITLRKKMPLRPSTSGVRSRLRSEMRLSTPPTSAVRVLISRARLARYSS